mgnify:CR=1 FL=1
MSRIKSKNNPSLLHKSWQMNTPSQLIITPKGKFITEKLSYTLQIKRINGTLNKEEQATLKEMEEMGWFC